MASIRLDCTICPKRPEFSDVSHLLTHLASKGHLSHYFKAQVKSRQDTQLLVELQKFDKWYSENDLDRLLHDRMVQKERKKSSGRGRQPATRANQSALSRSSVRADSFQNFLDPQLAASSLQGHFPRNRSYRSSQDTGDQCQLDTTLGNSSIASVPAHASTIVHQVPEIAPNTSVGLLSPRPSNSSISRSLSADQDSDIEINEYVTLKGVIWPGMDLFDSASPHAKRIRNQKKDSSCLEQMRSYAATIEPNENIYYYPSWQLKRSREITGQVESSSPEREFTPRHQTHRGRTKRTRAGREPLKQLDPNRNLARRKGRKSSTKEFQKQHQALPSLPPVDRNRLYQGVINDWPSQNDDEINWQLAYDPFAPIETRSRMSIFRDDPDAGIRHRELSGTPCPQPQGRRSGRRGVSNNPVDHVVEESGASPPGHLGSLFDDKGSSLSFQEPYSQRYFNMDLDTDAYQVSNSVPPYIDFLMSYPPFSMNHTDQHRTADSQVLSNPLSMLPGIDSFLQSPGQANASPPSINPLLDVSNLFNHPITRESDDETIDDGVAEK